MRKFFLLTVLIGTLFISCSKDDDNSLKETSCDFVAEVVSVEGFNAINTSNYIVTDIQLNGDCLKITVSSSGCDPEPWKINLYSVNSFYTVYPYQRAVKIELINNQDCLAVFQKTVSFDLTSFQLNGQNNLPLNIEGWSEQIIYKY
ncbi:MAG TPA: hypothetical protein VNJ50_07900 [Gelidibacter sp.]|uniref:hypothetical protein n=1 Tax=Gelidibacter sp. TaxID=2018083 RepID=UPI002C4F9D90|nr:hypothetical protein [Gelidibacter sp.]HXJ98755.1 hypothetical protein [Gelidibacter sp.]